MPERAGVLEAFTFDYPSDWRREETLAFEKHGGGDVGPTMLVVTQVHLAEGETLAAFLDRVLGEARSLPDFVVVELGPYRLGAFKVTKARVRFRRNEQIVASTFVFIDAGAAGPVAVGCTTTRRSDADRDAVTTAQWAMIERVVSSLRVRVGDGAHDSAPPPVAEEAVPMPWLERSLPARESA